MLQSIGMTKRPLRNMLICEGLYVAALTLLAPFRISILAVGVVIRAMVSGGFTTFHFTLLPLVICTPILIVFAIIIPYICFKNLEKQSIVERLRAVDWWDDPPCGQRNRNWPHKKECVLLFLDPQSQKSKVHLIEERMSCGLLFIINHISQFLLWLLQIDLVLRI